MYTSVICLVVLCIFGGFIIPLTQSNVISDKSTLKDNDVLRDEDKLLLDIVSSESDSSSSSADVDFDDLSLEDQVRLLSKQMSALMTRRREDYKMLETSLKNSVRKNSQQFGDLDLRNELNQLR